MVKKNDRMVYQKPDGKWVNKRLGAGKVSSVHKTQKEA